MSTFSGMQLQHTTRAGWLTIQSLPYRNTPCLYYEDQPVNVIYRNNYCLLPE